jgi:hypothetical protein
MLIYFKNKNTRCPDTKVKNILVLAGILSVVAGGIQFSNAQDTTANPRAATTTTATTTTGEVRAAQPEKNAAAAAAIEFAEVGADIAGPTLKIPDGAESLRKVSAPVQNTGDTVLLDFYKLNGDIFADVLTAHKGGPWTQRNHIRVMSPLAIRPDKMTLTLRYLQPLRRRGFVIQGTDTSGDLAVVLPTGFGGKVSQQQFLAQSSEGVTHSYNFADQDSRGYTIVKATVDATGQVKPADDVQFFVWNGKQFIPRRAN